MAKSLRKKSVRKNSKTSKQRRSRKIHGGEPVGMCERLEQKIKNNEFSNFDDLKKSWGDTTGRLACGIDESKFNIIKNGDIYGEKVEKYINPSDDYSVPNGPMRKSIINDNNMGQFVNNTALSRGFRNPKKNEMPGGRSIRRRGNKRSGRRR